MDFNRRNLIRQVLVGGSLIFALVIVLGAIGAFSFIWFKTKEIKARVAQNEFYHVRMNNEQISKLYADVVFDLAVMRSRLRRELYVNNVLDEQGVALDVTPFVKLKPGYRGVAISRLGDEKWFYVGQNQTQWIEQKKLLKQDISTISDNTIAILGVQTRKDEVTHNEVPLSYLVTSWTESPSNQRIFMALEFSLEHVSDLLEKIFVPHLGTTLFVEPVSGVLFVPVASAEALDLGSVGSYMKFIDVFPEEYARMSGDGSGQLETPRGLFTFATVPPLPSSLVNNKTVAEITVENQVLKVLFSPWKNISFVPQDLLMTEVRAMKKIVWTTFSFGVLLSLFLFGILIKIQVDRVLAKNELAFERERSFHQSKMATIGEMASGIAHEINNPLAIIVWYCDAIKEMLETPPIEPANMTTVVEDIKSAAFRVSKIIKSMRAVARDAEQDPFVLTNINSVLDDTLVLSNKKIKDANVALKMLKAPNDELKVECRPAELSQVILNLINNACDAVEMMKEKWVQVEVKDMGTDIHVEVSDSGPGIPQEVREKMFNPFFTTKATGKGTGLGLSISQRIIEGHQGHLELLKETKQTTFLIRLPKSQQVLKPVSNAS